MSLSQIYTPGSQKKGGGLFGKIAGGLAGLAAGIAAIPTGGASLAAIPGVLGAMGAGSALGGMAGEGIKPTKNSPGGTGNRILETAMKSDPAAQLATVSDSQKSLKDYPLPGDQAQEAWDYFERAKQDLRKRMNLGVNSNIA